MKNFQPILSDNARLGISVLENRDFITRYYTNFFFIEKTIDFNAKISIREEFYSVVGREATPS
jgi:hypothetical protein